MPLREIVFSSVCIYTVRVNKKVS